MNKGWCSSCDMICVKDVHYLRRFFGLGRRDSLYSLPNRMASSNAGSFAKAPAIFSVQGLESLSSFFFSRATSASRAATRSFSFIVFMADPLLFAGLPPLLPYRALGRAPTDRRAALFFRQTGP